MDSSLQMPKLIKHASTSSTSFYTQQKSQTEINIQNSHLQHTDLNQDNLERKLLRTRGSICSKQSTRSRAFSATSRSSWQSTFNNIANMTEERLAELLDSLLALRLDYINNIHTADDVIIADINKKLELIKKQRGSEKYESITGKIDMIDNILAENWVESEVIKKKFNAVISNNTSNRNYGQYGTNLSAKFKQIFNNPPQKIESFMLDSPHKSLVVQTRYKSEYQAPDYDSINLYKIPKRKYEGNQAPTPSSNYQHQFYDYKNHSRPSIVKKQNFISSLGYHKGQLKSNYKSTFVENNSSPKTDYKDLDCYRNKIRTIKMMFMSKRKGPTQRQLKYSLLKSQPFFQVDKNRTPLKSYKGQFESSNTKDYQLPSLFIKNKPKNQSLNKKKLDLIYGQKSISASKKTFAQSRKQNIF